MSGAASPLEKPLKDLELVERLRKLAEVAPRIAIDFENEEDEHAGFDSIDMANWAKDEDRADWTCWNRDVLAFAVSRGRKVEGLASLGGNWFRVGENPLEVDPRMGGYVASKTLEALENLGLQVKKDRKLSASVVDAVEYVRQWLREEYEEQRKEREKYG